MLVLSMDWSAIFNQLGFYTPTRKSVLDEIKKAGKKTSRETILEGLLLLRRIWLKNNGRLGSPDTFDTTNFPELIDEDIRGLCNRINSLDYMKTTNCCSGHKNHMMATSGPGVDFSEHKIARYEFGYTSPSISIIYDVNDSRSNVFRKRLITNLNTFAKTRNVVVDLKTKQGYFYRNDRNVDVEIKYSQNKFQLEEIVAKLYIYPSKLEPLRAANNDNKFIGLWIDKLLANNYYNFAISEKVKNINVMFFECFENAIFQ